MKGVRQSCDHAEMAGYVQTPLCGDVSEEQGVSEEYVQKYMCASTGD